jgi:3-phenylpropionate/cinnamic acid dioxygenase small subunit
MTADLDANVRATVEITQLISRYGNCLDRGDFDGLVACFTEDAEFHVAPNPGVESPLKGPAGIRANIERRWKLFAETEQRRHVMTNIVVEEVSGETARARTVIIVFAVAREPGSTIRPHGLGVFDDILECHDGRWQFKERRLQLDRVDYFSPGWMSPD